jgi:hypothetical protein
VRSRGVTAKATVRRKTDALLTYVRCAAWSTRASRCALRARRRHQLLGRSSSATTHLLEDMHHRGLRAWWRDAGIRLVCRKSTARVLGSQRTTRVSTRSSTLSSASTPRSPRALAWLVNRLNAPSRSGGDS